MGLMMKKYTYSAKAQDNPGNWCVIDAADKILGRIATMAAHRLRGKHSPLYTPHTDMGDWVIVINAEKVALSGKKRKNKCYYRHSGYMGGLTTITAETLLEKRPEDVIRFAVKGMLPKNPLGRKIFKKLKVYAGPTHPHRAQQPKALDTE